MKVPATLLIISTLTACNPNFTNESSVVLAALKEPPGGEVMHFTALLKNAVLEVEDGCVRLHPSNQPESYLPIFPYGYSVDIQAKNSVILKPNGEVFATLGIKRDIGGGEMARIQTQYLTSPGNKCRGPYWRVSP